MNNQSNSILVLGASGGLGLHICKEVMRQFGADGLIVGDYKRERGEQTAQKLGAGVSLCQNSQSSAGATGVADMLGLFAQPVAYRVDNRSEMVRGFRKKRPFHYPSPIGTITHRLANFIEAEAVAEALAIPNVNFWTGYDKASFDKVISALNRLGILSLFNRPRWRTKLANLIAAGMSEAEDETCAIVAEAVGRKDGQVKTARVSILAGSDYGATALGVVAMAKMLLNGDVVAPGVHHPTQIFTLKPLLATMKSDDIRLFETAVHIQGEHQK